jgi:hypothetical protein
MRVRACVCVCVFVLARPGFGRSQGLMSVHWSPEACIADTQTKDGGLTKVMSATTTVRLVHLFSALSRRA